MDGHDDVASHLLDGRLVHELGRFAVPAKKKSSSCNGIVYDIKIEKNMQPVNVFYGVQLFIK